MFQHTIGFNSATDHRKGYRIYLCKNFLIIVALQYLISSSPIKLFKKNVIILRLLSS